MVKLVNVVQHVLMINYKFRISSIAIKPDSYWQGPRNFLGLQFLSCLL